LTLTTTEQKEWQELYEQAKSRGLFGRTYAMANVDEHFAMLSEYFFDVAPYRCSREQLARIDPAAFRMLRSIYEAQEPAR
jgi:hypothetical protein